jgi:hypothetical protein
MLSDSAARRLALYCRRAASEPPDHVDRPFGTARQSIRSVRYVNRQVRELVWRDVEVRTALLGDYDEVAEVVKRLGASPYALLDLATAMTLEHERAGV